MNVRQWFRASKCFAAATLSWCALLLLPASAQGQAPTTPVGTASATQTVTVTITAGGTLSNIYVLTQGATGLDFNAVSPNADPNACAVNAIYALNDTCTVQYTFAPTHPWVRYGSVSLADSSGNLLGNVFLAGLGTGPQVAYPLSAATVPGALGSGFFSLTGIAVDGKGNVYVADTAINAIKEIVAVGGIVSSTSSIVTLASGLNAPAGVAVDGAGNVYFADTGNSLVKEILAVGGVFPTTPQILTLGSNFSHPKGVAVDGSGNVYVADTSNSQIEEILAVNGIIPANNPTINVLGSGFLAPAGIFVDGSGNVFVADTGNSLVKEIVAVNGVIPSSNPTINTLGSGFSSPQGVSVDGSGNVYVADTANSLVREISGATTFTLGTGFTNPNAVALDGNGNVFVTDNGTNPATEMNVQTPPGLSFATTVLGATSTDSPKSFSLMNNGNAALIFSIPTTGSNPGISNNFSFASSTTTCPQLTPASTATASLSAGSSCVDAVNFTPMMAGSPLAGSVTSSDNNLNTSTSTQVTSLSGIGTPGTPVVTVASASVPVNTSTVTLAASVSYAGVTPTGSVTFAVNSGTAFSATCTGTSSPLSCTASYDLSSLNAGGYTIQASIASDSNYNTASGSGTLTITKGTPTLTVSSSGTSTVNGQVTFTVAVTPNGGIVPSGSLSLSTTLNGTTSAIAACTSAALTAGAGPTLTATCQTTALLAGSNSITASYAGDGNFNSASSAAFSQTVNQGTPVLTLAPTSGSSTVNNQVSYTVTVTPNSGIVPSGSVTFNTALGTAASTPISGCASLTLGANGAQPFTAICTTTSLLAGSNAITATIAADANFVSATTLTPATQTVAKATPVLTLSQSPASSMVNDLVTFTVAVSPNSGILPGGSISFSTAVGSGTANAIVGCTSVALVSGAGPTLTASCPTRTLLAGSNVVSAVIVSDANFNAATSNSVTQLVSKATTSLALVSSQPASSTVDQAVTFTATISLPSGNPFTTSPGGTVSFTANSTTIIGCNAVTVDSSTHAATCTTSALVAPSDVIVATYSSDPNFVGSTAPQLTQIVNKNTPAVSVSSTLPTTAVVNQPVTFMATITPSGASSAGVVPTGNVTFTRNGSNICSPVVVASATNGTATASCSATFSSVFSGASIVATYSGDSNINTGTANVSQTVLAGSTTTTVTSATNPSAVNQSVNLTARVTATTSGTATPMSGSVTFTDSLDPTNPFCPTTLTVSGGVLQPAVCAHIFTSSGNHVVTAAFTSTDPNFSNSTTANSVTQVVNAATTTLTVANTALTTPTVNQTATFQATFSSPGQALPQGSVTYSDGATPICQNLPVTSGAIPSCMITFLTAGDHFITAAFTSSDANFGNVTSPQLRQPVNKNTPSVAVASSLPTSAVVNQTVTFTATVTPNQVISSSVAPTGSVTFTRGQGGPVLCSSVTVTTGPGSTAIASCSTAFSSIYTGTTIVGTYSGDTNFLSNGGNVSQTVLQGATSTTVTSATNPSAVNQSVTLTATVTPAIAAGPAFPQSGSLIFSDSTDPTNTFCPTTLTASAGVLQPATCQHIFTTSGPHTVTAAFTSSDANFNSSTTANGLAQTVNSAAITLTVTSSSTPSVNQQATFQATFSPLGQAIPQGMVAYFDGTAVICPNAAVTSTGASPNCTATFLTSGSHSITAIFTSSNGNFQQVLPATPFILTVSQNTPTVAITSPSSASTSTVGQGQTFTATVTPSEIIGNTTPTGTVAFSYSLGTQTGPICTTAALTASGSVSSASCPSSLILQGVYTISAQYSGDTNFSAGSVASLTETVGKATTALTVGPPATAQINVATSFTPSLSVTSMLTSSGTQTTQPTGDITLRDSGVANPICSIKIAVGAITCPYTFPTAGMHTITATYSGDSNFAGATSTPALVNVALGTPLITLSSSSITSVATQPVTFTATVTASPTGTVAPNNSKGNISFSVGGASYPCLATTAGSTTTTVTATCTVPGTDVGFGTKTQLQAPIPVTATFTADGNYSTVTSSVLSQVVQNFNPKSSIGKFSLTQGFSSASDPFLSTPITYSINPLNGFTDTTTTVCSVVDSSGKAVSGLTCTTSFTSTISASVTVTATSSAPLGDSTIMLTTTDTVNPGLSQPVTAVVTIVNQPATIFNVGIGTSAVSFALPSSFNSPAPSTLSCKSINDPSGIYNSLTKTYLSLAQVGLSCSTPFTAGATPNTYGFTITAKAVGATAKLNNAPTNIFAAALGAPLLLLIGLFPRVRKNRKALSRLLSVVALVAVSMIATACGGGFNNSTSASTTTAVFGSYVIPIVNAQNVTVAEVPVIIGSAN